MLLAEIEGGRTDEVADVLDEEQRAVGRFQPLHGVADHVRVEVAAFAGVDLQRWHTGGADALGVVGSLLITFDDLDGDRVLEQFDGLDEQARLARTRAGNEIERKHAVLVEPGAVLRSVAVVLAQDVAFDLHHARLAHAGDVGTRRAGAEIEVVVVVMVIVAMRMTVVVGVLAVMDMLMHVRRAVGVGVRMAMGIADLAVMAVRVLVIVCMVVFMHRSVGMDMTVRVRPAFDPDFAVTASANCTHSCLLFYSIAISLTRISVPPVGWTWWLPQTGQAPYNSFIGTVAAQGMHQPTPGTSTISSAAPSAIPPLVTTSKQKRSASGSTDDRRPISSTTKPTRAALSRRAVSSTSSMMPSASDISCIHPLHFVGQAGVQRQNRRLQPLTGCRCRRVTAVGEQCRQLRRPGKTGVGRRFEMIPRHLAVA